jgi:AI-2 transport protein TqsA
MTGVRPIPSTGPVIRGLLMFAAFIVVVAGLRAAAPILTPLALALFIAAVSLPVMEWLRRRGTPAPLAIFVVVLMNAAVLAAVGWILLVSFAELRTELPLYLSRAQDLERAARARLMMWGIETTPSLNGNLLQTQRFLDFATMAARRATVVGAGVLLVLLYLVFILAESASFPDRVRRVLGPNALGLNGVAATLREVQRYLVLKTIISMVTGVAIGSGAAFLGVDFALLWGFVAFALNFIPSIGSVVAAVPAIAVALLQLGPGTAFALAVIYLVVNVSVGNFADPILIGQQLRLSPFVILASLVFWSWTWGVIGAFLAVPLTVAIRIGLEHTQSLSRYAMLMGPLPREMLTKPPEPPPTTV